MYLLGLDIGTSGCKAAVFDTNGSLVANAYKEYSLIYPKRGWMELDPNIVAESVFWCIRQCTSVCNGLNISAVAVSSQGEAVIPVGFDGKPLANSIVTFDNRNVKEYEWFKSRFDKFRIMKITGAPQHTMFTITKILWIKNNLPEIFDNTWKFMCFGDYISYKLGAEPCIDYSMASRTMAFDIAKKEWSYEILKGCGISENSLPNPVPSGETIGSVHKAVAEDLKLSPDAIIVSGGHDQVCCSLGAGVLESGIAMDSLGTTESILCVNKDAVITPEMVDMNLPCYIYAVNNLYAYLTFLSSSGSILRWLRDNFMDSEEKDFYRAMDKTIEEKYKKPSGLFVLPHFSGSGTPYLDFNSRGVIAGLTLDTDKYQVYKAILEGTSYESRLNIECMEKCGIEVNELRCIGGGAKSRLWLQMKADITGKRVAELEVSEAGCLGAAILAGIGCGAFKTAEEAVDRYIRVKNEYLPDGDMHEIYSEAYSKYVNMYQLSKVLFA